VFQKHEPGYQIYSGCAAVRGIPLLGVLTCARRAQAEYFVVVQRLGLRFGVLSFRCNPRYDPFGEKPPSPRRGGESYSRSGEVFARPLNYARSMLETRSTTSERRPRAIQIWAEVLPHLRDLYKYDSITNARRSTLRYRAKVSVAAWLSGLIVQRTTRDTTCSATKNIT